MSSNVGPSSGWTERVFSAVLSIPLRFKITIPYLIVAMLLAAVATWLVSETIAQNLEERFRGQLVDNFAAATDGVFQAETTHLAAVRAMAHTAGVAEALEARDVTVLDALLRPVAVNAQLSLAHVVDANGELIYGLRLAGGEYEAGEAAAFADWAPVQKALSGARDDMGDKFAGVMDTPWGPALYTVGPVRSGASVVGAVLVGTPLSELITRLNSDSLANATVFRPDGPPAVTTFADGVSVPALSAEALTALSAQGTYQLQNRLLQFGARDFNEAVGPLYVRGRPSGWLLGVALPRALVTQNAELSPAQLGVWFALVVLAVIGLGVIVAQIVAIPVFDLVRASSRVADGDLNVAVRERSKDELGLLAQRFNHMVTELRQREFMRDVFGRVVSEEVREALLKGQVGLGGELKMVTVLFTDIRQFTTMSESHSPQEVVAVLNSYFGVVTGVIRETGGFVNKFGGDSTMAIFGAPVNAPPAETARKAIRAALIIRARLAEFNARRVESGQPPIAVGIGISTGEVITGNIGSAERFEYTVIGDAVNTAARVQGLTSKVAESAILITEATLTALSDPDEFQVADHGPIPLKGKAKPVRVYGVVGKRLTQGRPLLRVGDVPRPDILEALYLYCRGFSVETVAATKKASPVDVGRWLQGASEYFGAASQELKLSFELTDAELNRLRDFKARPEMSAPLAASLPIASVLALTAAPNGHGGMGE